jgi:hypothetical protein
MKMSKVYLAVPIIENRDVGKALRISKTIKDLGHRLLSEWVTETDPGFTVSAQEVFERDTNGVEDCDILVAEVSYPSHGVGMEIMKAQIRGKMILCLFKKGTAVSRMVLGIPKATMIEYSSEREMNEKLAEHLKK